MSTRPSPLQSAPQAGSACTGTARARATAFFFFQAEDGIRAFHVTGVHTCALPISARHAAGLVQERRLSGARRARTAEGASGVRKSVVVGKECRSRWSPYH